MRFAYWFFSLQENRVKNLMTTLACGAALSGR